MDWLYFAVTVMVVVLLYLVVMILLSDCDLNLLWHLKFGKAPGWYMYFCI